MLVIQRLNTDTSWRFLWGNTSLLIDPWLLGSEVDGFSWFNEQWHSINPFKIENLGSYQAILISQPFSDHCHEETLKQLEDKPLLATPLATKRLLKTFQKDRIITIPDLLSNNWLSYESLQIAYLKSTKKLSASFDGIVIRKENEQIVYCPHGFDLTPTQISLLNQVETKLLLAGFSKFELPFFLGGVVNPGKSNALKLIEALNPKNIVHTHDEDKPSKGIVKRLAKVFYPNFKELEQEFNGRYLYLGEDYTPINLV